MVTFEDIEMSHEFSMDPDEFSHVSVGVNAGEEDEAQVEKVARERFYWIRASRKVVLLFLLVACCAVASTTYMLLRNEDHDDYVKDYDRLVDNIAHIASIHIQTTKKVTAGVAEALSAAAAAHEGGFPFVTKPLFEVMGKNARDQSGADYFLYAPIVSETHLQRWVQYTENEKKWIEDSIVVAHDAGYFDAEQLLLNTDIDIQPTIVQRNSNGDVLPVEENGPWAPVWQTSPPPYDPKDVINFDVLSDHTLRPIVSAVEVVREGLLSPTFDAGSRTEVFVDPVLRSKQLRGSQTPVPYDVSNFPRSSFVQPVFEQINEGGASVVGVVIASLPWSIHLSGLLPDNVTGLMAVLTNSCGQVHTFELNGREALYKGPGDSHDRTYDKTERFIDLPVCDNCFVSEKTPGHCTYQVYVYSSATYENDTSSAVALIFSLSIAGVFGIMAISFLLYDRFVRQQNEMVVHAAAKSDAILKSLFPSKVRDRLFDEQSKALNVRKQKKKKGNARLLNYLQSGEFDPDDAEKKESGKEKGAFKTKPIADLFPETTIMFGDIAGFTAWSSVREPSQVFTLLETLYHAFDEIARKKRVFKVETVGDCYVAVTGLPDPQKDHAVIMCRFARACMLRVRHLTKELEITLGPDTADLAMRIGLHSGAVTAGVLRGEKSRFQLFGDTMNTASRMESTGTRDKIQVSQETHELLVAAGKDDWVTPRDEKVVAKGKGELQTYWLSVGVARSEVSSRPSDEDEAMLLVGEGDIYEAEAKEIFDSKTTRLIDWNVDVLLRLLRLIVAHRNSLPRRSYPPPPDEKKFQEELRTPLEEVSDVITLPKFNPQLCMIQDEADDVELADEIVHQLHDYVCNIAAMYQDNMFHSFEHASHVTMSVTKLLSRIVGPSDRDVDDYGENYEQLASSLHDNTFGITSDPLTQFACVFSALIHDVDHTGVPNTQLMVENSQISEYYGGKSVAEQNSVDLAWDLLMDDNYIDLRSLIYTSESELKRFRQLVVNSVLATDIMDKDLNAHRQERWERTFSEGAQAHDKSRDIINLKVTMVIEHLLQASDVAHTMQHWNIYRKWNERFFLECYEAYINGRSETNPADGWFEGELGFFDSYVLPLALKLKDCGVFGVSGDEYYNYAAQNREEWDLRGRELVGEMVKKIEKPEEAPSAHNQNMYVEPVRFEAT